MDHSSLDPSLPRRISGELVLDRSMQLLEQARERVPGLTHSLMKRPEQFSPGSFPVFLQRGRGALVEDVDGQEYIDFIGGLGVNLLGHNHPAVTAAIRRALEDGLLHSLPTPVEVRVAQALTKIIPGAEMLRFFKTGADATSAAVRLARHLTGKPRILTVGYNGWHDHFMVDTPGVPPQVAELTTRVPLFTPPDEGALLQRIVDGAPGLAAVLLSVPYNRCLDRGFVHELRATCTAHGVLFVLDEVVTGFRLALGGAQEFFGVQADLVCLSKALAAGMPLSALVGPRRTLERLGELQVSTTFGGELLSLAVCEAVLEEYASNDPTPRIAALGRQLRDGIQASAEALGCPLRVTGYDAIPCFRFAPDPAEHARAMSVFQGLMARRGVLLRRDVNFVSAAHTEAQIAYTVDQAHAAMQEMK